MAVFRLGQQLTAADRRPIGLYIVWRILDRVYLRWIVGSELPREVVCGPGLLLHHAGRGIVLHPHTVLGEDVNMYHGVTIGQRGPGRPPIIGDRVYLGVGATVIGPITVGDDAKIGAGAVVVTDVPAGATMVGVPAVQVSLRAPVVTVAAAGPQPAVRAAPAPLS
ncbi:serine O-acetyltransferase [Baekduia soli]|nr:serine acetyltransferase [Baekduia soli]